MRSRYSAFVFGLVDYLFETTHPNHRAKNLKADIASTCKGLAWTGLDVRDVWQGGEKDKVGKVTFHASFVQEGKNGVHVEHSTHIGPAPLSTLIRLRQRSGSDRGALADLRMELGIYGSGRIGLQTYVQATWANQTAMMSDFGIKALNASYSDIQPYSPTSGIRDTVIGLAGKIDINPDWIVVASLERKQLRDNAAKSPITEEKNANIFTIGTMHRF